MDVKVWLSNYSSLTTTKSFFKSRRGFQPYMDEYDESSVSISLIDAVVSQVIVSCVHNVLFEPQVRISYNYETKIPNHIKRIYAVDKLIEAAVHPEKSQNSRNINRSVSYAVNVDDRGRLFRRKSTFEDEKVDITLKLNERIISDAKDRPRGFTHGFNEGGIIIDNDILGNPKPRSDAPKSDEPTKPAEDDSHLKPSRLGDRSKVAPKRSTSSPMVKKPESTSDV